MTDTATTPDTATDARTYAQPTDIDRKAARLMVDLAEYLSEILGLGIQDHESYGKFYVSELRIGFDGEETGYRVVPDEFGGYALTTTSWTEARA